MVSRQSILKDAHSHHFKPVDQHSANLHSKFMTAEISPAPTQAAKKRGCFFFAFWGLLAGVVIFCAGIAATLWWMQRPVTPVQLSEDELNEVEVKVEQLQASSHPDGGASRYEAGGKHVEFTEHELNGLLNEHTDLADRLKFEIDRDALNAYVNIPIPEDSAILPGKTLKMRARLDVNFDTDQPELRVADVTIYGFSIPNAWLGGVKERNLARELFGADYSSSLSGIKTLKLERGKLALELEE